MLQHPSQTGVTTLMHTPLPMADLIANGTAGSRCRRERQCDGKGTTARHEIASLSVCYFLHAWCVLTSGGCSMSMGAGPPTSEVYHRKCSLLDQLVFEGISTAVSCAAQSHHVSPAIHPAIPSHVTSAKGCPESSRESPFAGKYGAASSDKQRGLCIRVLCPWRRAVRWSPRQGAIRVQRPIRCK